MPASSQTRVVIALTALACGPAQPDTAPVEIDCLTLTGGFEGADLDDLEARCHANGDTVCDREDWIEADAARCFSVGGRWSTNYRARFEAGLFLSVLEPHPQWSVSERGEPDECVATVAAASGEFLNLFCP